MKAAANEAKHGVPFAFAARVFLDPDVQIIEPVRERDNEARSKAIGCIDGRLFTVFTKRGETCRLISARRSNRTEERRYANHPL